MPGRLVWIAVFLFLLSLLLWRVSLRRVRTAWGFLVLAALVLMSGFLPDGWHPFTPLVGNAVCVALVELAGLQIFAILTFDLAFRKVKLPKFLIEMAVVVGYGAALFGLFYKLGVNVTGIFATSAVATAVLGLALQDMLTNIAGGIALELEGGIRMGDYITCDQHSGWVQHVRLRHTAIQTRDGDTVILPNSHLTKSPVRICSSPHRQYIPLTMPFSVNPQEVIDAVEFALRSSPLPGIAREPAPTCIVRELGTSAVELAAVVWLTLPGYETEAISAVNTRLYFALQRAGLPTAAISNPVELITPDARKTIDPVEAVRRTPVLRLLSDPDLFELAGRLHQVAFAPGEYIIQQGESGASMYIVVEGKVGILYADASGLSRQLAVMEAGDFFGEASMLTGEPRNATAVAQTRVDCYRLDNVDLQNVMARNPELAEDMSIVVAHRQMEFTQMRDQLDAETARKRESETQTQLLGRIRRFFSVAAGGA